MSIRVACPACKLERAVVCKPPLAAEAFGLHPEAVASAIWCFACGVVSIRLRRTKNAAPNEATIG